MDVREYSLLSPPIHWLKLASLDNIIQTHIDRVTVAMHSSLQCYWSTDWGIILLMWSRSGLPRTWNIETLVGPVQCFGPTFSCYPNRVMHLSALPSTQPHAVCAAFIHRLSSYWTHYYLTTQLLSSVATIGWWQQFKGYFYLTQHVCDNHFKLVFWQKPVSITIPAPLSWYLVPNTKVCNFFDFCTVWRLTEGGTP